MMCQLVKNTSLTLRRILTWSSVQVCFRALIFSQHHAALSHVMRRPRPFSLAREFLENTYWLTQWVRRPVNLHIDYQLPCLCVTVIPSKLKHAPQLQQKWIWLKPICSAGDNSFRSGCIVVSSKLNLLSEVMLIQSTSDHYVSPPRMIMRAHLWGDEYVLCMSCD